MPRNMDQLFCFFSGFAHRDVELLKYKENVEQGTVVLTCSNNGSRKLSEGQYIQLDGVLFEITATNGSFFRASSTVELLENTSIKKAKVRDKLTLGVLAESDLSHDCLWMLQPTAFGQVTYTAHSVLPDHQHTLKLDFEAPGELASVIKEDCHLGLSGASLTAKEVKSDGLLIKFSIYCGRETRENTQFNQHMLPGTQVNFTEAAEIENRAGL